LEWVGEYRSWIASNLIPIQTEPRNKPHHYRGAPLAVSVIAAFFFVLPGCRRLGWLRYADRVALCHFNILILCFVLFGTADAAALQFRSDEWLTQCDLRNETADHDCTINGLFSNKLLDGTQGSFSLLIDLVSGRVAVVGQPKPMRATIRIDKNPELGCLATPDCIFSADQSELIMAELAAGQLVLIDVVSSKTTFRVSLTTKGYRAGIEKLFAQGLQLKGTPKR
jgi:hypothetical protein